MTGATSAGKGGRIADRASPFVPPVNWTLSLSRSDQSINPSINQSVNQSTTSFNQSATSFNQLIRQLANRSMSQSIN